MKKKLFIMCAALMWTTFLMAQNISVVTANGATTLVRTLDEAIAIVNENPGCVVYLPGGGHPVSDDSKITKKVTIIGIGHNIKADNVDGYTTITGNLFFNEGSDGSSVMGCYLTRNINIGYDGKEVNDVLVRYCNIWDFNVWNNNCKGTVVNQCYIRGGSYFYCAECDFTHNIATFVRDLDNGTIENNILTGRYEGRHCAIDACDNCSIKYNVILGGNDGLMSGDNSFAERNMAKGAIAWGDSSYDIDPINVSEVEWTDIFENPDGVKPTSNYHFKEAYKQYENQVGVYVGNQFNNTGLPPVPYIVAKQIPMETDATGKLNIKIRVNAGQ